jgi:hypothetical protein
MLTCNSMNILHSPRCTWIDSSMFTKSILRGSSENPDDAKSTHATHLQKGMSADVKIEYIRRLVRQWLCLRSTDRMVNI